MQHSFELFLKARQTSTLGPIIDPFDEAQKNFVRETEEAAERLGFGQPDPRILVRKITSFAMMPWAM